MDKDKEKHAAPALDYLFGKIFFVPQTSNAKLKEKFKKVKYFVFKP